MKRMTGYQIISILKETEAGLPIKEICRKYGIGNSAHTKVFSIPHSTLSV